MTREKKTAYLGLGTNLGDRLANLNYSLELLFQKPGLQLKACSNIYETKPVGGPEQGLFLNACIALETSLAPGELLQTMLIVEHKMKRVRKERWGPRIIDLDLLVYEGTIVNTPVLQLPHPRLAKRDFVLLPLADIAPELFIPGINQTVKQILAGRKTNSDVKLYPGSDWCRSL